MLKKLLREIANQAAEFAMEAHGYEEDNANRITAWRKDIAEYIEEMKCIEANGREEDMIWEQGYIAGLSRGVRDYHELLKEHLHKQIKLCKDDGKEEAFKSILNKIK